METDNKSKFVYAKTEIENVKQYEIGIIDEENEDTFSVNFIVENKKIIVNKNQVELFNPLETGDLFPKKVCNICHRLLNTELFAKKPKWQRG